MRTFMAIALLCGAVVFGQNAEPTKQEIEEAYRSKAGESGFVFPGFRWERWRINEVRGWALKFKRLHHERGVGILTLRYQATARKDGRCAEYQIVDTRVLPPPNPQIKIESSIHVEPSGVKACR